MAPRNHAGGAGDGCIRSGISRCCHTPIPARFGYNPSTIQNVGEEFFTLRIFLLADRHRGRATSTRGPAPGRKLPGASAQPTGPACAHWNRKAATAPRAAGSRRDSRYLTAAPPPGAPAHSHFPWRVPTTLQMCECDNCDSLAGSKSRHGTHTPLIERLIHRV